MLSSRSRTLTIISTSGGIRDAVSVTVLADSVFVWLNTDSKPVTRTTPNQLFVSPQGRLQLRFLAAMSCYHVCAGVNSCLDPTTGTTDQIVRNPATNRV